MLRLDGPGRIRIRLAKLIEERLGCECDPHDIWMNRYPEARYLDLARWGVTCRFPNGLQKNVHSWDTMQNCIRGGLLIVDEDNFSVEVCGR